MKSIYKQSKELLAKIEQANNDTDKLNTIFSTLLKLQTESRKSAIKETLIIK